MSVYKTPKSPYWQFDFQLKGRRFHGSTGVETKRLAEEIERRKRQKAALGELDAHDVETLDEAVGLWWTEIGQHRASARQIEHRLKIIVRLIGPATRIHDITTRTVSRAIEVRRGEVYARGRDQKAGKGRPAKKAARYDLANSTVNSDIIKWLRAVLNRARKTWEIKGLPEIDWQTLRLQEPEAEILHFANDYQRAWMDACGPTERFALEILFTYGLRFSEIYFHPAAYLPDTPEGPSLAVNKRKKGALYVTLREGHARQIAARVGVAEAAGLENIWIERNKAGKLITVTKGALHSRIRTAAKRAGVDHRRLVHSIRHHFGTDFLADTKDIRMTQQALGHRDIRSTLVYAHALASGVRSAINSRNSPGADSDRPEFVVPEQRRSKA